METQAHLHQHTALQKTITLHQILQKQAQQGQPVVQVLQAQQHQALPLQKKLFDLAFWAPYLHA